MLTNDKTPIANPFGLLLNPAEVLQAVERSDRLERLQRRICRPLDKPLVVRGSSDMLDYDGAIDAEGDAL